MHSQSGFLSAGLVALFLSKNVRIIFGTILLSVSSNLFSSLDAVISDFADIDGDSSSEIVTEMRVVTEGLFAFKSLRNLFVQDGEFFFLFFYLFPLITSLILLI